MATRDNFQILKREHDREVYYVAICLPLGLTVYEKTPEEAWNRLTEAFTVLVNIICKELPIQEDSAK